MVRISGQRGVPVTVIDGQVVVGFDQARLAHLIAQARRPRLGAAVAEASEMAAKGRCVVTQGAYVGKVAPDSPAARAGLRAGDVIVSIANQPVRSVSDLESLISRLRPGHAVPLSYWRGTGQYATTLQL